MTQFRNRDDAARQLSARLAHLRGRNPLVLGVPRGAVPMARVIAEALHGDLDVVLVRKLRAPGQPELAIGAVDETGAVVKGAYYDSVPDDYTREEIHTQRGILRARRELYTRARPPIDPAGRIVVLVDDGVATGSSMIAAIHAVRARSPKSIIVAIGAAPPDTLARLEAEADEVVCLLSPRFFYAVGQFYEDFSEVTDDMVVEALRPADTHRRRGEKVAS